MNDRIDLTGIEVYARHGVLAHEQIKAQVFEVDVSAYTDLAPAGESDDLADTVDYSALAIEIREVVGSESHKLLETVASRVADIVLQHPRVTRAVVTIHKPNAPLELAFRDVSVTVERFRQ